MHTLTPYLVLADAPAAIDFYTRAFNATELGRLPGPGGRIMHAELQIGDSSLLLCSEFPEYQNTRSPLALGGSPVCIHLSHPDVDAAFTQAVAAGATAQMPPTDMFWGDRYCKLRDPFGHEWSIATPKQKLTWDQLRQIAATMGQPAQDEAKRQQHQQQQ